MNKNSYTILIILMMFFTSSLFANGKVTGKVYDKPSEEPLIGANVFLMNTSMGSATDFDGYYKIENIPAGKYTMTVKYLGYDTQTFEIVIVDGKTLEMNVGLDYMTIEGEEVLVTAQAIGQMQAINKQITSNSVKNIVSSSKIKELPESNAAEAVGRLPGVSLQREGGEGNKVVIRGLSPQYNKISINGISMAATGDVDRSVDLSMISPNILNGIEVSKTAMADQEADQLGGTVNFMLRDAPEKPTFNVTMQGGYNGLRDEIKNSYYAIGGGMRFFDNKLGVFVQGNYENTDRSSNSANAYYAIQFDSISLANNLNFQDVERINKRSGGVLVLDYDLSSTKIKFSNTINNLDGNTYTRQETFDPVGRLHNYQGIYTEKTLLTMMNSLNVESNFEGINIVGSINYSQSKTDIPEEIEMSAYENNAFVNSWSWDDYSIDPFDIPSKALNNISQSKVDQFYGREITTLEEESSANLSLEREFKTDFALFNLKIGGAYKHKYKKYDIEQYEIPLGWQDMALSRLYLARKFGLTNYDYSNDDFPYAPFIDSDYDAGDFKSGGDYIISRVPDKDLMLEVYNEIKNLKTVNGAPTGKTLWYDYTDSHLNDYHGNEDYYAAFVVPTISFANNMITFIPGFRYEKTTTEYTANRSNGAGKPTDPFIYFAYTSKKNNDYLLPMIHLKYQAFDWFDIRASYTQTLARPNYNLLIPTWSAFGSSITWNNVDLKPAKSQNMDLFLSFYSDKIGLISVGFFEKQIADFAFATTTFISDEDQIRPEWPSIVSKGGQIFSYSNSTNIAKLRGLEAEWQSNLWFLPGLLKGLVVNVNYTYADSETKYPKFVPIYERVPGPLPLQRLVGTADKSYNDRLLDQPTHILNVTVGFDYADFSIRSSVQYKSDVFISTNFFEELRSTTEPLTLWNMKIRQKMPVDGLQVFLNVNNFNKAVDKSSNFGTGYFASRSYYGLTADLGVTYIID